MAATRSFYTQLQLAQLWLRQGKGQQAAAKFAELSASYPENEEVWKGLVLGLQKSGSYDQALEAVHRIPTAVASVLENDVDYVSAVTGLYKDTNSVEDAARFLREATSRFASQGRTVPPALTIQLAWLLVDKPGTERDLFVLLRNARTRTDYSAEQRKVLNDIWTAWLTRSANASVVAGDTRHAISSLKPVSACCPQKCVCSVHLRLLYSLAAMLNVPPQSTRRLDSGARVSVGLRSCCGRGHRRGRNAVGTELDERGPDAVPRGTLSCF